ncbi:PREDICTED: F-box/LRR-repeat protein 2 [Ipomoea nil]|uniref:F-box/LRR-repeat protein 2 n=1 Tax=Ipomoea nil TaxID=35883 RepID=UPI000901F754|nr:PREDICTED: F-box/LRR-repeat protein 2 [Ipomoea nil]
MDALLCDELLQEIFRRLPPSSSAAVSLVSKRWLSLLRSSTTSLSLLLHQPHVSPALSSFLSQHPYLSALSVNAAASSTAASDHVIRLVASSCPNLSHLRFLAGPVSPFSLFSLSSSCPRLSSLDVALCRPLSFLWLAPFENLKRLSVQSVANSSDSEYLKFGNSNLLDEFPDSELNLESLCLSGIGSGDYGLTWVWRNCRKIKTLKLKRCEGVGDNASFSGFLQRLEGLEEVELRSCRPIANGVLLKLAENCVSLNSFLLHDGGSKDGLLQFITETKCSLQKLDFRLPLDLDNRHLNAIAESFRGLTILRLQSCCLVTGEGLRRVGRAVGGGVDELALVNCDVVERESGLLATLGQNMKRLRKLDLSYNEMLVDKELMSMLVSCNGLKELRLRGCNRLTNVAMASMTKSCKGLERVDIMNCCGIEAEAVEQFVVNSAALTHLQVEETKLSSVAIMWASNHFIQLI